MLVVVVAVLACAALAYVALPLAGRRVHAPTEPSPEEELDARKTAALTAIVDLETERAVGKLSEGDFEVLRSRYEAEALQALAEIDDLVRGAGRARRSPLRVTPAEDDRAVEDEIAAMRERLECPRCGGLRSASGTCPECHPAT